MNVFSKLLVTAIAMVGLSLAACGGQATGPTASDTAEVEQGLARVSTPIGQLSDTDCPVGQMICESGVSHCDTTSCISVRECLQCVAGSYSTAGYAGVTILVEPF